MQLLNMQFSPVFAASCPGVQIPSSAPYFQTPSASYIRDEVSHPYKKHAQFFSFVGRFSPATAEAASLSGIVEHTHTHTLGKTPLNLAIIVTESAAYTTHNKHNRGVSMPLAGFEPPVSRVERLQTCALDRAATEFIHAQLSFCMF